MMHFISIFAQLLIIIILKKLKVKYVSHFIFEFEARYFCNWVLDGYKNSDTQRSFKNI